MNQQCKGQNCTATNGVGHSPECLFEHFLSYTGYWSQPEDIRALLKQAYFDGIDAGKPVVPLLQYAPEFLRRAADIMTERGKQYDKPEGERSMGKCVTAFNIVTGRDLTEAEGWLLLQILKDVRQWQRPGFHQDSAEDCIAYAALKAEAKQKEAYCNGR